MPLGKTKQCYCSPLAVWNIYKPILSRNGDVLRFSFILSVAFGLMFNRHQRLKGVALFMCNYGRFKARRRGFRLCCSIVKDFDVGKSACNILMVFFVVINIPAFVCLAPFGANLSGFLFHICMSGSIWRQSVGLSVSAFHLTQN